jgi:peptidoglycan hydrolase CwlO-like protein
MTKNRALILLAIFFIVSVFTNYVQYDLLRDKTTASEEMKSVLTVQIDQAQRRIAQREATINDLVFKLDSASVSNKSVQEADKREIRVLRKRERGLRVDTITVSLVDTIFALQDSVILAVELDRNRISRECHQAFDSLQSQISDLKLVVAKTDTLKQFAERDLKQERKKGKWLKRGLVGVSVLAVWLAIKPD